MSFKKNDKLKVVEAIATYGISEGATVYALEDEFKDSGELRVRISYSRGGKEIGSKVGWYTSRFELVPVAPALDLTKPLETKGGESVTLITTEGRGDYPLIGYIGNRPGITEWTKEGQLYIGNTHPALDLRNVKPKPVTRECTGYVNIFKSKEGKLYMGGAFEGTTEPYNHPNAVGRVKVSITAVEGQFDN